MTQRFSLYEDLTVVENLDFYAALYGVPRKKHRLRVRQMLDEGGLATRKDQLAGTLSGGWKQRLALACATIHEPKLVFLDEPTAGVDPVSRREFWERIHDLSASGTTLIVTTHYMDEAERCHRLCFIFSGNVLELGSPREITERRGLWVTEVETDQVARASELLRSSSGVLECAHFGNTIRLVIRSDHSPDAWLRELLEPLGINHLQVARPNVEDAFVALVKEWQS